MALLIILKFVFWTSFIQLLRHLWMSHSDHDLICNMLFQLTLSHHGPQVQSAVKPNTRKSCSTFQHATKNLHKMAKAAFKVLLCRHQSEQKDAFFCKLHVSDPGKLFSLVRRAATEPAAVWQREHMNRVWKLGESVIDEQHHLCTLVTLPCIEPMIEQLLQEVLSLLSMPSAHSSDESICLLHSNSTGPFVCQFKLWLGSIDLSKLFIEREFTGKF